MPGWQELHEELQEEQFTVVAVAIDENLDSIIELAKGVTYPVLMDKDHILTELYAISNVPSVLWIDEDGRISRPAASEFGTDTFSEITGVSREGHMQQVREWVRDGTLPEDASFVVEDLSNEEIQARKMGINSVPTFIINKQIVINGAQTSENFEIIFQKLKNSLN